MHNNRSLGNQQSSISWDASNPWCTYHDPLGISLNPTLARHKHPAMWMVPSYSSSWLTSPNLLLLSNTFTFSHFSTFDLLSPLRLLPNSRIGKGRQNVYEGLSMIKKKKREEWIALVFPGRKWENSSCGVNLQIQHNLDKNKVLNMPIISNKAFSNLNIS